MKKTIGIAAAVFACLSVFGQEKDKENGSVGSVEINVVDQYKASVKAPTKLAEQPGFSDTTTKKLPISYSIKPELLRFSFSPKPIKPVRVSGVRLKKLPKNMVRLGAGNYASALAEVVISNSRSKTFNWDVALRHFSSQSGVKNVAYDKMPFMENALWLGGKWLIKDFRIRAGAGAEVNSFGFYGVPEGTAQVLYPEELQKNNYQRYFGRVEFERVFKKKLQIFQKAGINYHYFTNNWSSNEHLLNVNTNWNYPQKVKDHIIGAELNADWQYTTMGNTGNTSNQLNLQFFPKAMGKLDWFSYVLGLNFNFYNTVKNTEAGTDLNFNVYFFPEIAVNAELAKDVLSVFAGWTGDVTVNGLYSLTKQNPYFNPTGNVVPTAVNRLFGGAEGAVTKNMAYKLQGGYNFIESMALFTRSGDSLTMPINGINVPALDVMYVGGQYFDARGELTYTGKTTAVSGYAEVYTYNIDITEDAETNKHPFHLPKLKVGVEVSQTFKSKFDVNAGLAYIGGRKALVADGQIYQADMKDIWDARLDIGYNINNNLSAGLHFNNLASQQYDVWLGYPAQRLRVMLSLMYTF